MITFALIGAVASHVGAFAAGFAFSYLFFAANKNKKAAVDEAVAKIKAELKNQP